MTFSLKAQVLGLLGCLLMFVDHCKKLGLMSPFSIDQSPGGGKDSNGP